MFEYRRKLCGLNHSKGGLTLIELLVVLAIISILGAVGFPIYSNYLTTAAEVDAKNALRAISIAQERFKLINGVYFPNPPGATSVNTTISASLLNNQSLNTKYFTYTIQTTGCAPQPVTGIARQFCAIARKNNSTVTFTIDHTDKIYNQLGVEVQ